MKTWPDWKALTAAEVAALESMTPEDSLMLAEIVRRMNKEHARLPNLGHRMDLAAVGPDGLLRQEVRSTYIRSVYREFVYG